MRHIVLLSALVTLAGCTVIIGDPNRYVSDGAVDDAGRDAMIDGGVDGGPQEPLPPRGSGIGLSDYRPVPGQTLRAVLGPSNDPNGDSLTTQIEWLVDDEVADGETGTSFLVDATAAPGTRVAVRVTLSDGELSTVIEAGPAVVEADDVTRWRMLLPPRGRAGGGSLGLFDPIRQRLLWVSHTATATALWELQLDAGGTADRSGWVRLDSVRGAPPANGGGSAVPDPARDRILFFGAQGSDGFRSNELWSLELSGSQGNERWAQITGGTPPSPRSTAATIPFVTQDGHDAILFYDGLDEAEMPIGDAWILHTGDGDRWEQLAGAMPDPRRLLPAGVFDPATHRVYIVGGAIFGATMEEIAGSDEIWALDTHDLASGFQQVGTLPEHGVFAATAMVSGRTAYVLGGAVDFLAGANPDVFSIDLDSLEATSRPSSGSPNQPIALGSSRAPFGDTAVVFTRDFDRGGLRFHTVNPTTGSWTPISAEDENLPGAIMQGQAMAGPGGLTLSHGRSSTSTAIGLDRVYRLRDGRFERIAASGPEPGPRWGNVSDNRGLDDDLMFWFSGGHPPGESLPRSIFRMEGGQTTWTEISVRTGESIPDDRVGHVIIHGHCRDTAAPGMPGHFAGTFGGRDASSGTLLDETRLAICDFATDGNCQWIDPIVAGAPRPPPLAWAGVTQFRDEAGFDTRHTIVLFGEGASGPVDQAWYMDACNSRPMSQQWRTVSMSAAPPARMGHSITQTPLPGTVHPVGRAFLLFGGATEDGDGVNGEVWTFEWDPLLNSLTFTDLTPTIESPVAPDPRMFHLAAYDEAQRRILVYGGLGTDGVLDDLWELRIRDF